MDKDSTKGDYPKEQKHPWVVYIIVAIIILFPLTMFVIKHRIANRNRIQKPSQGTYLKQRT